MRRKSSPPAPDDAQAARERCLRLLSLRARSAAELQERLRSIGFARHVIESVLADLARAGLVDDAEFARNWVASRQAAGGTGRRKLRWELRRKGVSEELIRQAVDSAVSAEIEIEQALGLARRRLTGGRYDVKDMARIKRLLLSRGFGFDTVENVMRQMVPEMEH